MSFYDIIYEQSNLKKENLFEKGNLWTGGDRGPLVIFINCI